MSLTRFHVEISKGLREFLQGAADEFDVIGLSEVKSERSFRRESLEVVGEDLAAATSPLGMLHPMEESLQEIVGSRNDADTSAFVFRQQNDVAPE